MERSLLQSFDGVLGLIHRMLGFRWHVILIVFGQNFGGSEQALVIELALGHHAFTFAKQVRQDPGVSY
jgi:hypothetical protein